MTLIPSRKLNEWHATAKRGARDILDILIEFRDEYLPDFKAENVLMEAYGELGNTLMMASETVRGKVGNLRAYPKDKLLYWFDHDIAFDHLDKANALAEFAHKPPAQLLDEAINPGNATGDTMTVRELVTFALGEVRQPMRAEVYHFTVEYQRLRKFPSRFGWEPEKTERYNDWLERGKEFFAQEAQP